MTKNMNNTKTIQKDEVKKRIEPYKQNERPNKTKKMAQTKLT